MYTKISIKYINYTNVRKGVFRNAGVQNKKAESMDAAMEIVAEIGFAAFSMKKVTNRIDVAEGLIYKHFYTKDNLFYCCFEPVHKQIADYLIISASHVRKN